MQIFADFAGYSLIALGLAELFGYRLPENFRFPYISRSFSEFWTRWHISLSTWLKEYLYVPLGGNRKGRWRTYLNLFVVMILGGLWHGAAWSYAVWGAFHGVALAVEKLLRADRPSAEELWAIQWLRMACVFSAVTLGWLLFKLPHFEDVLLYFKAIGHNLHFQKNRATLLLVPLYALPVIAYHLYHVYTARRSDSGLFRWHFVFYGIMLFLLIVGSGGSGDFIYFQF